MNVIVSWHLLLAIIFACSAFLYASDKAVPASLFLMIATFGIWIKIEVTSKSDARVNRPEV